MHILTLLLTNETSFSYHLIPDNFHGSPGLVKKEPKLRIAPSIRINNLEEPDNPKILLLAEKTRDLFYPLRMQKQLFNSWLTDVTETVRDKIGINTTLSKLGLQTPEEFFYRLFMGKESTIPTLHNSMIPSDPTLRNILLGLYTDAILKHDTEELDKMNWAFGTGKSVPIHLLTGTNFSPLLDKTGDLFEQLVRLITKDEAEVEIFADNLTISLLSNDEGKQVYLNPGEAMPFSTLIKDNVTKEIYVLVGGIGQDDQGNVLNRFKNSAWSDNITGAYAIKLSDALKYITPLDDDNNILEAMKNIIKIGGPIAIVLMTIFAPEVLPGFLLKGSLKVSARAEAVYTAIKFAISRGITTIIP